MSPRNSQRIPQPFLARGCVLLLLGILLPAATLPLGAETLYGTDFESFPVGNDNWVGTDGWVGTGVGHAIHGIDSNIVQGLGKSAFLGYNRPPTRSTRVWRPVSYDPVSNGTPVIEFECLMGIEDSTNYRGDSFYFSFYNKLGQFLAAIHFNNASNQSIFRSDAVHQVDTGFDFNHGDLHLLHCEVNFASNVWLATLDGIPMFEDATFNASGQTLDLYAVAAEWQLSLNNTNLYGNNWLLVADWYIRAIYPDGQDPFVLQQTLSGTSDSALISWLGEPGHTYDVQCSTNLATGFTNAPAGAFTNITTSADLTYTGQIENTASPRFYRVIRSVIP